MANKIPVLTQLKAVAAAAKNFTMKNVSELAETVVAAIEEVEQTAVPKTRKVNGKALSADIALNASDVGAAASGHTHSNYVPTTRKVNGKALSADITLGASDVGAAPTSHSHSNYLTTSQRGTANGVASLGADGKVPASQLGAVGLMPQIVVTCPSGSSVTCKSGSTTLTATSNGTAVFNLPGYGTCTVTITFGGASTSKTVVVDAVKQYNVYPFNNKLSDNSWNQIALASETHVAKDVWQVGDEMNITVNGETLTLVILDFEHDDLADGSGKAGITFGLKNLMKDTRAMNTSGAVYNNTSMHSYLNGTVYNGMPTELRNVIKDVKKKVTIPSGTTPTISTANMKLFLFSGAETGGAGGRGEGTRYSYFATNPSRVRYLANGAGSKSAWYFRSSYETSSNYYYFERIDAGQPYCTVSTKQGVCFGFCV